MSSLCVLVVFDFNQNVFQGYKENVTLKKLIIHINKGKTCVCFLLHHLFTSNLETSIDISCTKLYEKLKLYNTKYHPTRQTTSSNIHIIIPITTRFHQPASFSAYLIIADFSHIGPTSLTPSSLPKHFLFRSFLYQPPIRLNSLSYSILDIYNTTYKIKITNYRS